MLAGYRSSHALSPASDHHALVAKSAAAYYSPWSPTSAASSTGHYGAVGAGEPTNADGSATIEYSSLTCTNPAAVMGYDSTVSVHLVPYPAGAGATDGYGGYPTVSSAALVRSSMTSAGPTTPPSPYSGFRGLGGLASALPSSADRSGQSGSAAAGTSPIVGRNPLPSASGQNRPATAHDLGGNSGHYSASSYDAYHHHPGHHQQHHHTASHSGSHHRGSAETAYATAAPDPAYDYKPRVSESLSPGGGANSSNCGGGSAATTGELPNGRQYHVAHAAGEQPHSYVTSCGVRPADDARNASAAHHGSGSAAGTLVKST